MVYGKSVERFKKMIPFFSIGMPVHNSYKFLSRTFKSVMSQTFEDFEIVCVNDGSTDNTLSLLEDFAFKDSRIKIFTNSVNKGIAYTRQRVTSLIQGKFFIWMDSDDELETRCLEHLFSVFKEEENKDAIVLQNAWIVNGNKKNMLYNFKHLISDPYEIQKKILLNNSIYSYPWSLIGKSSFFQKIDYPEKAYNFIDDKLVSYKYLDNASKVIYIPIPNYIHYLYQGTDSHNSQFFYRLSNTYSYLMKNLPNTLINCKEILPLLTDLNFGLYIAKQKDSKQYEYYKKWILKIKKKKFPSFNYLKQLGMKQMIQWLWMFFLPRSFYFYYHRREFIK